VASARAYLVLDDPDSARQSIRGVLGATRKPVSRYLLTEAMLVEACIAGRALEMITTALDVAHGELVLPFVQACDAFAGLLARHQAIAARWPATPAADPGNVADALRDQAVRHLSVQLTQREQTVLAYLATSMTAAEIAAELYLSVNTVKTHLAAIYRKLGAGGRRAAVRRARELELL
jgi:LuxR family maltose regulon positive regulatory protein